MWACWNASPWLFICAHSLFFNSPFSSRSRAMPLSWLRTRKKSKVLLCGKCHFFQSFSVLFFRTGMLVVRGWLRAVLYSTLFLSLSSIPTTTCRFSGPLVLKADFLFVFEDLLCFRQSNSLAQVISTCVLEYKVQFINYLFCLQSFKFAKQPTFSHQHD